MRHPAGRRGPSYIAPQALHPNPRPCPHPNPVRLPRLALLRPGERRRSTGCPSWLVKASPTLDRLPFSIRVLLENVLALRGPGHRHRGPRPRGRRLAAERRARPSEIPFMPARVVLQDFTGVPCVVDLAAMRDAMARMGGDPDRINPVVPCDLVIDHSVQVDYYGIGGGVPAKRRSRVGAQRRALSAAQVRPARLPQLPGGPARAPASCTRSTSSTWRRWCSSGTSSASSPPIPTPWSAPTRTPR